MSAAVNLMGPQRLGNSSSVIKLCWAFVGSILWWVYLTRSKRVRNTYLATEWQKRKRLVLLIIPPPTLLDLIDAAYDQRERTGYSDST
jgi:hypothetical protein